MSDQDAVRCKCQDHKQAIFDRPLLFLPIVVLMFASFVLLFFLADLPFGIQLGSLIPYTCLIVLSTFGAQHGQQPYFFKCATVQSTMKRLVRRHIVFLIAIVLIETIAFSLTRYMPPSWLVAKGRSVPPFDISLCIFCFFLALVEISSNRSLIERAHREKNVVL
jgi:hypothetical protein